MKTQLVRTWLQRAVPALAALFVMANANIASANEIVLNETVPYGHESSNPVDIIPITFTGGDLSLALDGDYYDGISVGGFDPYVYLYTADGSYLDEDDDEGGSYNSLLSLTGVAAGDYLVAVAHWSTVGVSSVQRDDLVAAAIANPEDYTTNGGSATYALTMFSVSGTVSLTGEATSVPELSASGTTTAAAFLLAGAAVVMSPRRRDA